MLLSTATTTDKDNNMTDDQIISKGLATLRRHIKDGRSIEDAAELTVIEMQDALLSRA